MPHLIIDTDAGIDDAHALMMALRHPAADIVAITAVNGNIEVEQVTRNIAKILDVCQCDVPFYQGASSPLVAPHFFAKYVHGDDGLGDASLAESSRLAQDEHAVHALLRLVNESPGEYTLVALGPLTNIALAVRLDPTFPAKLKDFIFMGGTIAAHGNVSFVAEFNIFVDPEAAHIVLDSFPMATMLSWETTMQHSIDWDWVMTWLATDTPVGRFNAAITQQIIKFVNSTGSAEAGFAMPDPLTIAIALEPDIVRASESRYISVELNGTHTRGQTLVDWVDRYKKPHNINLITNVDLGRFRDLLLATVQ